MTTPCQLSATAYSMYSQLPSITWGRSSIRNLTTHHAMLTGTHLTRLWIKHMKKFFKLKSDTSKLAQGTSFLFALWRFPFRIWAPICPLRLIFFSCFRRAFRKIRRHYLKLYHNCGLSYPLRFIMHYHVSVMYYRMTATLPLLYHLEQLNLFITPLEITKSNQWGAICTSVYL
jgi:hypothetical protein